MSQHRSLPHRGELVLLRGMRLPDDPDEFCPDEQWFSLVLVPDTQAYVREDKKAATFDCQTEWLKANKDLRIGERHEGIKFVLHEGDIVYGGSSSDHWARGKRSMCVVDGEIPWTAAPGNMDQPGSVNNDVYLYFPLSLVAPGCTTFPCALSTRARSINGSRPRIDSSAPPASTGCHSHSGSGFPTMP